MTARGKLCFRAHSCFISITSGRMLTFTNKSTINPYEIFSWLHVPAIAGHYKLRAGEIHAS